MTHEFSNPARGNVTASQERAIEDAITHIERIVFSPQMEALQASFGYEPYVGVDRTVAIDLMFVFGEAYLDNRQGKERQAVTGVIFTEEQERCVTELRDALGIERETNAPEGLKPAVVAVPGGANQSNLLRFEKAKQQQDEVLSPSAQPIIVGMGSGRQLKDAEKANVANYAPNAETEADLVNAALEATFGVTEYDLRYFHPLEAETAGSTEPWEVRYYTLPNDQLAITVNAPKIEGREKPNSADGLLAAAEILGPEVLTNNDVLIATTDIYVDFQAAEAMRFWGLKYGSNIHTAGYTPTKPRPLPSISQEVNSYIRKAKYLNDAVDQKRSEADPVADSTSAIALYKERLAQEAANIALNAITSDPSPDATN